MNQTGERDLKNDEYLNRSDGLIHCKKCQAPRQKIIVYGGKKYKPDCLCKCEVEARDRKEEEEKQRDHMRYISSLRSAGLHDKAYYNYTFANDKGFCKEIGRAKEYAANWNEMKEKGIGLLFWGRPGTGKTFCSACIANALLDQGVSVLMTNFSSILNAVSGLYAEDKNRYLAELNQYEMLIIDDLGAERNSDYVREQVYNVIDSRYRSRKPFIITTNLTLQELKDPADPENARTYDRILERCIPICVNTKNIRKDLAEKNMNFAKEKLIGKSIKTKEGEMKHGDRNGP